MCGVERCTNNGSRLEKKTQMTVLGICVKSDFSLQIKDDKDIVEYRRHAKKGYKDSI